MYCDSISSGTSPSGITTITGNKSTKFKLVTYFICRFIQTHTIYIRKSYLPVIGGNEDEEEADDGHRMNVNGENMYI